jgi:hypothetical protein
MSPNPHLTTRVTPVLHKITTESNPYTKSTDSNHTHIFFQPQRPFKCRNIFVWCHQDTIIHQVTIENMKNLVIPTPGLVFTPKDPQNNEIIPFETIEKWFKENILSLIINGIGIPSLYLNVCDVQFQFTMQFEGEIETIALYGQELLSDTGTLQTTNQVPSY